MENPEMINDLATLVKLDEPQLLDAIKIRFSKDKIYVSHQNYNQIYGRIQKLVILSVTP